MCLSDADVQSLKIKLNRDGAKECVLCERILKQNLIRFVPLCILGHHFDVQYPSNFFENWKCTTIQKFGVNEFFLKVINTLIQQGCIKRIVHL